ncbi:tetratricopeptide repeat protein [Bacillus sp. EB01]|uniref:tetratricopeptide repeat protein n=1 Tax=Bacillus sp. EB01 TaxID=1347086 RepID=UPI0005C4F726|nr:tetratricopeptide repeat protein [Bacillus sp. EB01]
MKKEDGDNIVLFPNVERRLVEKGIEALQDKQFREAIELLEQGYELDSDNEDVMAALVLAYFEAGALNKAKELCKEMLIVGQGDYFQIVEMYITILIQLHEYKEITKILEALIEEKEVPAEKKEHFITILQFCQRLSEQEPVQPLEEMEAETSHQEELKPGDLDLFSKTDLNEQVGIAGKLSNQNIRPFVEEISTFLSAEEGHPFLKTMLLNILREQEVTNVINVRKFGMLEKINPEELKPPHSQPNDNEAGVQLIKALEHQDPLLLESALSLLARHAFAVYPFELLPADQAAWAAAFEYTALLYLGNEPDIERLAEKYGTIAEHVSEAASWIRKVEEISYPII